MSRGIKIAHNDKEVQKKIVAQDVNSVSGVEVYAPSDKVAVKFAPPPKTATAKTVAPKVEKTETKQNDASKDQKNKLAMQMMMQDRAMSR
ncbi:MAG: hypothetical protein BWY78_01027 [Alphaproteobacteria bacterium ADurb.Bin438]|nr:MAG: hypothetical protein BWY78_01027 [Alphaproteobacteria bacterium ADurb.Bin438]